MRYGTQVAGSRNPKLTAYLLLNESKYDRWSLVPTGSKGKLAGRQQKLTIDLDTVNALAAIGCTHAEMAKVLGCSEEWIQAQNAENPAFQLALEQGEGELKQSLRRQQLKHAFEGNASLLIWLGKQYLGQVDKQDIKTTTEVSITVRKAQEELKGISKEQILEAHRLLSAKTIEGNTS